MQEDEINNILVLQITIFFFFKRSLLNLYNIAWGFPGGTSGKEPICQCGRNRHWFDLLEEVMVTHSGILAWRIRMDGGTQAA